MEILTNLVQEIGSNLNIKFNLENTENFYRDGVYMRFKGVSKTVPVFLLLEGYKEKIKAYVLVGESRIDSKVFSNKIYFSPTKSKKAIERDLLERLGLKNIGEEIEKIVEAREIAQKKREREAEKLEMLKQYIPNLYVHGNGIDGYFRDGSSSVSVTINHSKTDISLRSGSTDFLMRVCAAVADIYKDMYQKH